MYTFDSRIRYSEVDSDGKLSTAALINYFQDCSTFQSEDLGAGVAALKERNLVWVLCFWQIVVDRYPALCERVTIGTQPYEMKAFMGLRNFMMTDEQGNYCARANSVWSLLDTRTGRPVPVPPDMHEIFKLFPKLEMEYAPRKIALPGEGVKKDPITVKEHHLDTNHHVNNQQWVVMAMRSLPEGFPVGEVRAEYRRQVYLGDVLVPVVYEPGDGRMIVSMTDEAGSPCMIAEFIPRA